MQTPSYLSLVRPSSSILAFALTGCLAGAALFGSAVTASAQTTKTLKGDFRISDGRRGTFVNTITVSGNTRTENVILTADNAQTSTDATTTVVNGDGSRTVDFTHTGFGETASFTSHKIVTREKHGNFAGTGTFTTAAGTSGTLTTLETKAESVNVVSAVYNDATKGTSNDLRVEDSGLGFAVLKSVDLDPSGNVSTLVITRYITSIK